MPLPATLPEFVSTVGTEEVMTSTTLPKFMSTVGAEKEAMPSIDIACFYKQA
jgi:hypothetical protein